VTYTLATLRVDGRATPVLILGGRHYRLEDVAPELLSTDPRRDLMTVLGSWTTAEAQLHRVAAALAEGELSCPEVPAPAGLEDWLTPLQYPAKVICAGSNYLDHVTKDGGHASFSKDDNIPVFFMKPPTTTLVGQGASVRFPVQSDKFDYEVELAVVIGRGGRRIAEVAALDHVAGYAVGIDLSARDWQRHPQHLVKFDLFGGKAFDDSCPLGPGIVPARFVDPGNLQLRLKVNGELRQDANTSDMIWPVAELIALVSEHVTLEPGDVLMTGTPSGVGLATETWLGVGDVIEASIDGLGTLQVEIVPDDDVNGAAR
jgi:2-keto-4-pentenoate hydratase/2-oxohepta-3-ene-1,7-dioic acid hydratase in catechol pathway